MKSVYLPETHATRLHVECVCGDGGSYCIETKRCKTIQIPDGVVDVIVTPLDGGERASVSLLGGEMRIGHSAEFTVTR